MAIFVDKYVRFDQPIEIIPTRIDIVCFFTKMDDNNYNTKLFHGDEKLVAMVKSNYWQFEHGKLQYPFLVI